MTKQLTILRTAVGSPVAPFVIHELKSKLNCKVIGADMDAMACGGLFCDKFYEVDTVSSPNYINRLLEICRDESVDVFWPDLDEELLLVSNHRYAFEMIGVKIVLSDEGALQTCVSKFNTFKFLSSIDIPCPYTTYDCMEIGNSINYPFILKPDKGRGSKGVFEIKEPRDFEYFWSEGNVLQELLKGNEYTVDTLSDFQGNFVYASIRQRIATDSGISVKGKTVKNDQVIEYVKKACNKLKLKGPACFQYFESPVGEVKFIEINPRIAGTASISILAGAPLITDTIQALLGNKLKSPKEYKYGFSVSRYWSEVVV